MTKADGRRRVRRAHPGQAEVRRAACFTRSCRRSTWSEAWSTLEGRPRAGVPAAVPSTPNLDAARLFGYAAAARNDAGKVGSAADGLGRVPAVRGKVTAPRRQLPARKAE